MFARKSYPFLEYQTKTLSKVLSCHKYQTRTLDLLVFWKRLHDPKQKQRIVLRLQDLYIRSRVGCLLCIFLWRSMTRLCSWNPLEICYTPFVTRPEIFFSFFKCFEYFLWCVSRVFVVLTVVLFFCEFPITWEVDLCVKCGHDRQTTHMLQW